VDLPFEPNRRPVFESDTRRPRVGVGARDDGAGDVVEPPLCVDLASKVASVFLTRSVPVAGPPPAVVTLGDTQCQPPAFPGPSDSPRYFCLRAAPTTSSRSTVKCRRPLGPSRLGASSTANAALQRSAVVDHVIPGVWSVFCFYSGVWVGVESCPSEEAWREVCSLQHRQLPKSKTAWSFPPTLRGKPALAAETSTGWRGRPVDTKAGISFRGSTVVQSWARG